MTAKRRHECAVVADLCFLAKNVAVICVGRMSCGTRRWWGEVSRGRAGALIT